MAKQQKLTPKQTKFAETYVQTGSNREAALAAGYSASNENTLDAGASRALRSLRNLGALLPDGIAITREGMQIRLRELSLDAQSCGQFGPAVRAEELLGKSIGMWIDQQLTVVSGSEHV